MTKIEKKIAEEDCPHMKRRLEIREEIDRIRYGK